MTQRSEPSKLKNVKCTIKNLPQVVGLAPDMLSSCHKTNHIDDLNKKIFSNVLSSLRVLGIKNRELNPPKSSIIAPDGNVQTLFAYWKAQIAMIPPFYESATTPVASEFPPFHFISRYRVKAILKNLCVKRPYVAVSLKNCLKGCDPPPEEFRGVAAVEALIRLAATEEPKNIKWAAYKACAREVIGKLYPRGVSASYSRIASHSASFENNRHQGGQLAGFLDHMFTPDLVGYLHETGDRQPTPIYSYYEPREVDSDWVGARTCKLSFKDEALKVRVLTIGPSELYSQLRLIQRSLWKGLERSQIFSLTHTSIDDFDPTMFNMGAKIVSGDFSAATDTIPPTVTRILTDLIAELSSDVNAKILLGRGASMMYIKYGDIVVKQTMGQLMGNPISFPLLCIHNLIMYILSTPARTFDEDLPVKINGDDIAFVELYPGHFVRWSEVVAYYGQKLSKGKNFLSDRFFQINNKFYLRDDAPSGFRRIDGLNSKSLWIQGKSTTEHVEKSFSSISDQRDHLTTNFDVAKSYSVGVDSCPSIESKKRFHSQFVKNNRFWVTRYYCPYWLPHFGGLGLQRRLGNDFYLHRSNLTYQMRGYYQMIRKPETPVYPGLAACGKIPDELTFYDYSRHYFSLPISKGSFEDFNLGKKIGRLASSWASSHHFPDRDSKSLAVVPDDLKRKMDIYDFLENSVLNDSFIQGTSIKGQVFRGIIINPLMDPFD